VYYVSLGAQRDRDVPTPAVGAAAVGLETLRAYVVGLGGHLDIVTRIGSIQLNVARASWRLIVTVWGWRTAARSSDHSIQI
jgi:hypothetical protein